MELDSLVRDTLRDWAREAEVPPGLADRALRGRVRGRVRRRVRTAGFTMGLAALVTAACLIAVNLAVPDPKAPQGDPELAKVVTAPGVAGTDVRADPESSPPKRLVTAGRMALSAYFTGRPRTWYLYDPSTGGYAKTPWALLAVAKGLGRAAVLEGPLPARRVGIYDMVGRRIIKWLPVERPAGGLAWSPDARRLLVTHYSGDPDPEIDEEAGGEMVEIPRSTRTGYSVVDLVSGRTEFHALPPDEDGNPRQDLGWSRDGSLIWSPTTTVPTKKFYTLDGQPRPAPKHEDQSYDDEAGLSPDGRHVATDAGPGPGPMTGVADAGTGRIVGTQPVEQLVAWADDRNLIAVACDLERCTGKGEFRNRFVQVDIGGKTIVPLTGYRENSQEPDAWHPLFTRR